MLMIWLFGCQENQDLGAFIAEVNSRPAGRIEPLRAIKRYEHYRYSLSELRSPFQPPWLDKDKVLEAEGGRRKEPLEFYPLDSLKLVGFLKRNGEVWALIVDKEGMVHHLKKGNYIGQNEGKINNIWDDKIELIEKRRNSVGDWVKKAVIINLLYYSRGTE